MHLYVDDVEIVFSKALSAGAVSIMEPNERPHGDRMAGVKDPCENIWWIAAMRICKNYPLEAPKHVTTS